MSTVRENYEMECPSCKSDKDIQIQIELWVNLTPDGTLVGDQDHEWVGENPARCTYCDHVGTVRDFAAKSWRRERLLREKAKRLHEKEGEIEIDEDATVSRSKDGAYVAAWVWVPHKEEEEPE
jgi:hypothetical protein